MKIACTTLGCKLNYAETSTYERGFRAAGHETVSWDEPADAYLVNTCAVTVTAEKKSRNLIRKAHKLAPSAPVVVTGCYAELKRAEILRIEGVARVFGAKEKGLVVPETLKLLAQNGPEQVLFSQTCTHADGRGPLAGGVKTTLPPGRCLCGETCMHARGRDWCHCEAVSAIN